MVALHCGKAHMQSQWERAKFDPLLTSKSLKIFKFEPDNHDYVYEIYTSANFHSNPFSRSFSPDRWNITGLWLFSIVGWLYCIFLEHAPIEPWMDFHGLWLIRCVFAHDGHFGGGDNIAIHSGVMSLKTTQNGVWIGNFKPNGPNIKSRYLAKYNLVNLIVFFYVVVYCSTICMRFS